MPTTDTAATLLEYQGRIQTLCKGGVLGHYFPFFVNFTQSDKFSNENGGVTPCTPPSGYAAEYMVKI